MPRFNFMLFYAFKMAVDIAFLRGFAIEAIATAILNASKSLKFYIKVVV